MANTLSVYDPVFYANEALIALEKALGMAGRVYRELDKTPNDRGSVTSIRKPATFTVGNAPAAAQDLTADSVSVTLDQWKEVKFALTDKELAFTGQQIINEHIRPAAYALADNIDQAVAGLYTDVPWYSDLTNPAAVADITAARAIMAGNNVPMEDGRLHFMVDPTNEAELLNLSAFSQWQGAGATGADTQMRGSLGTKFGYEVFMNQNVQSHTSGVSADAAGAIDLGAGYAAGTTTIHVDLVTDGGTAVVGDILTITGHTQQYVVTANVTFTGAEGDVSIAPGLESAVVDDQVVTIELGGASKAQNMMFHRNAFGLVMGSLPDMANELGANVATVPSPDGTLSVRSRIYYVGNSSEVHVALDVLYGVVTLDRNMACRVRDQA